MKQSLDLLLNILLDTFDLPKENIGIFIQNNLSMKHIPKPQRMKAKKSAGYSTKWLQVNPQEKKKNLPSH